MTDKQKHDNSAIDSLIQGYKQFKLQNFEQSNTFEDLVKYGQKPKALVIACCDSRVDPAIVTGCHPGELFVIRNIANLVPPFQDNPSRYDSTSAALKYGVTDLEVSDIILFGHSYCGGIRALVETPEENLSSDCISTWVSIAKPAKQRVLEKHPQSSLKEQAHYCEKESLLNSLRNLETFPWIQKRLLNNQLSLHTWYFNLDTGVIETYQSATGNFVPLTE